MNDLPDHHGPADGLIEAAAQARIDERARAAASELRRPAPEGGLAGVRRARRNRQITRAAVGGTAALALVVGGLVGITRRDDGAEIGPVDTLPVPTVTDPNPETTNSQPVATDPQPVTTDPGPETTDDPASPVVSDEVLPDPLGFAADGFERVLVDKTIVVRSDPEQVIPVDVPDLVTNLYGVGPNGVAYLLVQDETFTFARVIAVPTSGPTTGAVYELVPPFENDSPWLGVMAPDGIDLGLLVTGLKAPYVDVDGSALDPATDPTFTWSVTYRFDDDFQAATIVVTDETTGAEYEVPEREPVIEGQFDRAARPLPDGRVTVQLLRAGSTPVMWALTPSTGTWTQHPTP